MSSEIGTGGAPSGLRDCGLRAMLDAFLRCRAVLERTSQDLPACEVLSTSKVRIRASSQAPEIPPTHCAQLHTGVTVLLDDQWSAPCPESAPQPR